MDISPLGVVSRLDLAAFVAKLQSDLAIHPEGWENANLPSFLRALSAYLEDIDGWCKNMAPEVDSDRASWQLFAIALVGARVYE